MVTLPDDVRIRATALAADFGFDVDEALVRYDEAADDDEQSAWISVAFEFSRELREHYAYL